MFGRFWVALLFLWGGQPRFPLLNHCHVGKCSFHSAISVAIQGTGLVIEIPIALQTGLYSYEGAQ